MVRLWNRGDLQHLGAKNVESYLSMQRRAQGNEDVHAGMRIWNSKLAVYDLTKQEMSALETSIASLLEKNFSVALHFTDLGACRVILDGLGLRASTAGQLGGGVSVCLRSLTGFDWGQGWPSFCLAVGKALWGRSVF